MFTGDDSDCGLRCFCPAMAAAGLGEILDVALRFSIDEEQRVPTNAGWLRVNELKRTY